MDSLSGDALIAKADEIAERAHRGQIDKIGQPYINHPRRVAGRVVTPEAKAAALSPASGWAHRLRGECPQHDGVTSRVTTAPRECGSVRTWYHMWHHVSAHISAGAGADVADVTRAL